MNNLAQKKLNRRTFLATIGAAVVLPFLPLAPQPDLKQRMLGYINELSDLYKNGDSRDRATLIEETRNLGLSPKGQKWLDDVMQAIVKTNGGAK